jgi:hypothetical protein
MAIDGMESSAVEDDLFLISAKPVSILIPKDFLRSVMVTQGRWCQRCTGQARREPTGGNRPGNGR